MYGLQMACVLAYRWHACVWPTDGMCSGLQMACVCIVNLHTNNAIIFLIFANDVIFLNRHVCKTVYSDSYCVFLLCFTCDLLEL